MHTKIVCTKSMALEQPDVRIRSSLACVACYIPYDCHLYQGQLSGLSEDYRVEGQDSRSISRATYLWGTPSNRSMPAPFRSLLSFSILSFVLQETQQRHTHNTLTNPPTNRAPIEVRASPNSCSMIGSMAGI